MRLRFEFDTNYPSLVLWDPANRLMARPSRWFGTGRARKAAIEAARGHRLLLVDLPADGPQTVDVLIDEPLPKHLLERAWLRVDALGLRVPSGRIVASGLEGAQDDRAGQALPAGNYTVTVLAPDWSLDETAPLPEAPPPAGPVVVGANALIALTAVAALATLIVGIREAWRGALLLAGLPLLVVWFVALVATRPRGGEHARMRRAASEARFPVVAVRLRRLPHPEDVLDLRAAHVDLDAPIESSPPEIAVVR